MRRSIILSWMRSQPVSRLDVVSSSKAAIAVVARVPGCCVAVDGLV
jgi:hypothetical protein